jgi:hypothetical protein
MRNKKTKIMKKRESSMILKKRKNSIENKIFRNLLIKKN